MLANKSNGNFSLDLRDLTEWLAIMTLPLNVDERYQFYTYEKHKPSTISFKLALCMKQNKSNGHFYLKWEKKNKSISLIAHMLCMTILNHTILPLS